LASALEEGEITAQLETSLVINQEELQQKAINYAYVIKTVEYDISAIDEELKRLQAVKKAKNNVIDRMKESVVNAMGIYCMEKISSPTMNLSLRRSESVEVDLTEVLPDDFKITKTTVTPDKVAIKQAIKQGENITGATLKVNYSLQIK
jgi:uncharacterized protein YktB (UPF0637 family)